MLSCIALIMRHNVFRHAFEPIVIPQDHIQTAHCPAAFVDFLGVRTFLLAFGVVSLNFLCFLRIQDDAGKPRLILERHSDAVSHGLFHRISVNDRPKDIHRVFNRSAREAHKRGVRQGIMEVLCKSELHECSRLLPLAAVLNFQTLAEIKLRAVSFVAEADDVAPTGEQPRRLAELLHRRHEHAARLTRKQLVLQVLTTLERANSLITQKVR